MNAINFCIFAAVFTVTVDCDLGSISTDNDNVSTRFILMAIDETFTILWTVNGGSTARDIDCAMQDAMTVIGTNYCRLAWWNITG